MSLPLLRLLRSIGLVCIGLALAATAAAHDAGLSVAQVRVRGDTLELSVSYALKDVQRMLPPSVRLGTDSSQGTINAAQNELNQLGSLLWDVRMDGVELPVQDLTLEFTASDNLAFHWFYAKPAKGRIVFRSANLGSLPSTHRELFSVADAQGRPRFEKMLETKDATVAVSLDELAQDPPPPSSSPSNATSAARAASSSEKSEESPAGFLAFFKLGVEHIWTGYDHLLFLLGLLVVCRRFKSIVGIITCFTVAHSLTLGLAALHVASLPSWLVEPLIAASIVYVGIENFYLPEKDQARRGVITFCFGLIHGFGFASALSDLGLGQNGASILKPLVAFNLGVETGQICVAAVVLPILWWAFRSEKIRIRGVRFISATVTAAGAYWLLERTIFS